MRSAALLLFALVACAPAVTARKVRGPDGERDWVAITCKGQQGLCIERAGEVCPRGYDIAGERGHDGQRTVVVSEQGTFRAAIVPAYDGELLVKCHGAPAWWMSNPTRFRTCFHAESCDAGDECSYADDPDAKYGRCRAPR